MELRNECHAMQSIHQSPQWVSVNVDPEWVRITRQREASKGIYFLLFGKVGQTTGARPENSGLVSEPSISALQILPYFMKNM